jgi:hypothetical protein
MKRWFPLTALVIVGLVASPVAAMVVRPSFGSALKGSDRIVVGQVAKEVHDAEGHPLIEIEVSETWRGAPVERLVVDVTGRELSPDRPRPIVGERALFVLNQHPKLPWPMLSGQGFGYLPIISLGGHEYVRGAWSNELVGLVISAEGPNGVGRCYLLTSLRLWTAAA